MSIEEALKRLGGWDHLFVAKEGATEVARELGIEEEIPMEKMYDSRFDFKGLTLWEADGYEDPDVYLKKMKEDWDYNDTEMERQERIVQNYMKPDPDGYGYPGIPYAYGIDATDFAEWACRKLGVKYQSYLGRGFQLRGCIDALREHFGLKEVKA